MKKTNNNKTKNTSSSKEIKLPLINQNKKTINRIDKNTSASQKQRVSDAINVMCAVGLIKKNKQEIQYINYKNKENNSINLNNVINLNEEKEEETILNNKDNNYIIAEIYQISILKMLLI